MPRILTVRCDESKGGERCREVYSHSLKRCPACGTCVDPLTVDCESCELAWPCAFAIEDADTALRGWAAGDFAAEAAAELIIRSKLRDKLVPRYLDWSPWGFVAVPDFTALLRDLDDGDAYLSSSERTLLTLAGNIVQGPTGAGADLDLRTLFALDETNVAAVCDSLTPALRRRPRLAVAR